MQPQSVAHKILLALTPIALIAFGFLTLVIPASARAAQAQTSVAGGYYPPSSMSPWVTSIESPKGACTASLIAPDRVLTAAHCVVGDLTPGDWTVRVGVRDRSNPAEGQTRAVTGIVVHPLASLPETGVHQNHAFYDMAVMFINPPVTTIAPAVIGTESDWGSVGTALGWGHYNYDHDHPLYDPRLKAVNLSMGSDSDCEYWINSGGVQHYFSAIHICAYDQAGVNCITHGDSGGPLTINGKLVGVTSFFPLGTGWGPCGSVSMVGFAWVAGPTLRSWPLTVASPALAAAPVPVVSAACRAAQERVAAAVSKLHRRQRSLRNAQFYAEARRARKSVKKARRGVRAARSSAASACAV